MKIYALIEIRPENKGEKFCNAYCGYSLYSRKKDSSICVLFNKKTKNILGRELRCRQCIQAEKDAESARGKGGE